VQLDTISTSSTDLESAPAWGPSPLHDPKTAARPDWRTVDLALREIAARRAALDAEEVRWLREADALQIWRPLGMVSALDYLERVLGYSPRTAQDRLRVARALGALPELTAALARGLLPISAIRELTRVATPATEARWIERATGKTLRQIEEIVADRRQGDDPDDPPDPQARSHVVRFDLAAQTYALLRQVRTMLDDEHGTRLSDDALVAALCNAVLDDAPDGEPSGRAKYQIAMTVCERCHKGWQHGGGAKIVVDPAAVERARCDAQQIGPIDGSAPERAYQDIPPSVMRFVWHRDGGRCRIPGCRSARGLEAHHLVHRADGGSHDARNVILACSACHQAHHEGRLTISGTADRLEVGRPDAAARARDAREASAGRARVAEHGTVKPDNTGDSPIAECVAKPTIGAHVGASADANVDAGREAASCPVGHSKLDAAILRTQAKAALTGLGWKPAIAHAAVTAAAAEGAAWTLEELIRTSLRRCPMPRA
jgi:hypothetical protein